MLRLEVLKPLAAKLAGSATCSCPFMVSACSIQSTTRVKPFICTMPMRLDEGWNQIQFNLADFTRRAYGKQGKHAKSCSKQGWHSAVPGS